MTSIWHRKLWTFHCAEYRTSSEEQLHFCCDVTSLKHMFQRDWMISLVNMFFYQGCFLYKFLEEGSSVYHRSTSVAVSMTVVTRFTWQLKNILNEGSWILLAQNKWNKKDKLIMAFVFFFYSITRLATHLSNCTRFLKDHWAKKNPHFIL